MFNLQVAELEYKRGNYKNAYKICKNIIKSQPASAHALLLGGCIKLQLQQPRDAVVLFLKARKIAPNDTTILLNLAIAESHLGRNESAVAAYNKILEIKPNFAEARLNLAVLLANDGKYEEAEGHYQELLEADKYFSAAYYNRGNLYQRIGKNKEAILDYTFVLDKNPRNARAFLERGNALFKLGDYPGAITDYQNALLIDPNIKNLRLNIAQTHFANRNYDEANSFIMDILKNDPNHAEALYIKAKLFYQKNSLVDARKILEKIIKKFPNHSSALHGLSILRLKTGDFTKGWDLYENRWDADINTSKKLTTKNPRWRGAVTSKKVLVWSEQGIGDQVLFGTLLAEVSQKCEHLFVQIDNRLQPIFARSLPNIQFVDSNFLLIDSNFDLQIPIGSLAGIFRTSYDDFTGFTGKFLNYDKEKQNYFLKKLNKKPSDIIVGLSWKSIGKPDGDLRSIELKQIIGAIKGKKNCVFVSLQYGDVEHELQDVFISEGVRVRTFNEFSNFHDIDDLCSLIATCDSVISIDNSTLHLAGALGVESYGLLPFSADWRWGVNRNRSYWFNSIRLIRQVSVNNWSNVLTALSNQFK
jgi:tetratricopeptide (TPR) repeat protein